jgi:hypothetical protein
MDPATAGLIANASQCREEPRFLQAILNNNWQLRIGRVGSPWLGAGMHASKKPPRGRL